MYAIVEDSGTQIKLSTGDVFNVDLRDVEGDAITLDNVLMIASQQSALRMLKALQLLLKYLKKSKAKNLTSLSLSVVKAIAEKLVTVNAT